MFEIGNVLVSLDVAQQYFCCDLEACHGACCIAGDAGAPVSADEAQALATVVDLIADDLTPSGLRALRAGGTSYLDIEGDRVTTLCDEGEACAFCHFAPGGMCLCAVEKARRQGRTDVDKPISCSLYPLREKRYDTFTALNYHQWDICKPAIALGRKRGVRLYQFLREPLTRRFGKEWYDELALTCEEFNRQYPDGLRR